MSVGRPLKVFQVESSCAVLLEYKGTRNVLLFENDCLVSLENKNAFKCSKVVDSYGCIGVFYPWRSKQSSGRFLVCITGCASVGRIMESEVLRINDLMFIPLFGESVDRNAFSEIKRLLCSGSFYFTCLNVNENDSRMFDISKSFQHVATGVEVDAFLWNRHLVSYFRVRGINFTSWCVPVICGGVEIKTVYIGSQQAQTAVISRLSCNRVGTRYNVRGVDDDGHVANFVETEQLIVVGSKCTSFIQIRGSVPVHWEQPGLNVGSHKVKLPMTLEISLKAFNKHFHSLRHAYSDCAIVNLLGCKEGEASLTAAYQKHHGKSDFAESIPFVSFDYHSECRVGKFSNISKLMSKIQPFLDSKGILCSSGNDVVLQNGVVRVNCLDCLDRTNSVQSHIGLQMLVRQLETLGCANEQLVSRFSEAVKVLWQQTGDMISRMYSGTAALEGKDKVGKLKDGARSISRAIQNNLLDQGKQEAMDRLLLSHPLPPDLLFCAKDLLKPSQFMHASSKSLRGLCRRRGNFVDAYDVRVCVATWNVNGGKLFRSIAFKDKGLKDWLVHESSDRHTYYQALFKYESAEPDDLNLEVDEIVLVDYKLEDGEWLHGKKEGLSGIFPASYAVELNNPSIVLHDFPAQEEGDLELWTNEVVNVLEANGDWLKGEVYRNGEMFSGIFPSGFVSPLSSNTPVDIYAVGLEEMVELNAGNIINASQANQQAWATELHKTISSKDDYVLLMSEQLVGVCLFIYVRHNLVPHIRDVSPCAIKTGLGGTTGNKGAVGVSCVLFGSALCFVCSHFAAGQTQVQERNDNYNDLSNKLVFSKGRRLFDHDYIFWCGDFNYRIDLPGDKIKEHVKNMEWDELKKFDQLLEQKRAGNTFKGFEEGNIEFAPTYKYDPFSDDYDTSEKCRSPAWTDRVLWKCQGRLLGFFSEESDANDESSVVLNRYCRAELKISDHRPVVTEFDVKLALVDEDRRKAVYQDVIDMLEPINSVVFVCTKGWNRADLCRGFIQSLSVEDPLLIRYLGYCMLVVYDNSEVVDEIVALDGSVFQSNTIHVFRRADEIPSSFKDSDNVDVETETMNGMQELTQAHSAITETAETPLARPPPPPRPTVAPENGTPSVATVDKPPAKIPPPRPPAAPQHSSSIGGMADQGSARVPPPRPPSIPQYGNNPVEKAGQPIEVIVPPRLTTAAPQSTPGTTSVHNPALLEATWTTQPGPHTASQADPSNQPKPPPRPSLSPDSSKTVASTPSHPLVTPPPHPTVDCDEAGLYLVAQPPRQESPHQPSGVSSVEVSGQTSLSHLFVTSGNSSVSAKAERGLPSRKAPPRPAAFPSVKSSPSLTIAGGLEQLPTSHSYGTLFNNDDIFAGVTSSVPSSNGVASSKPPKIKPRKTVPKRRAPRPPPMTQHKSTPITQHKSAPSPRNTPTLPATSLLDEPINNDLLLDDLMPPPLIPVPRAAETHPCNQQSNDGYGSTPFDL